MNAYLLVGIGGAIGAMARYGAGVAVGQLWRDPFPLATLLINITGSLAMGLLIGWLARTLPSMQNEIRIFVGVGILGGYTTFSAFSLEVVTLIERGNLGPALLYVLASVLVSVAALWLGLLAMRLGSPV